MSATFLETQLGWFSTGCRPDPRTPALAARTCGRMWTSHSCEISPFTRTPDIHGDHVAVPVAFKSFRIILKVTEYQDFFDIFLVPLGASLVAQLVKNPPAMQETWVRSLDWEDPLEKGKAAPSSILAWRIPWTIQPMGSQRVRHD